MDSNDRKTNRGMRRDKDVAPTTPRNATERSAATASITGAFLLDATSADAALLLTLEPGVAETTGVALVEVYEVQ